MYRHYLLQTGGINPDEALRELDSIDFQGTHEPAPTADTDIERYLQSRKEQNILSSIEDGIARATSDFDAFVAKNVTTEWDSQKNRIFEHFGLLQKAPGETQTEPRRPALGASLGGSRFGASSFGRSRGGARPDFGRASTWGRSSFSATAFGKSVAPPTEVETKPSAFVDIDSSKQLDVTRQVETRQAKDVEVIRGLNVARLSKNPFGLIGALQKTTEGSGSDVLTGQLSESWKLLGSIVGEKPGDASSPKERAYAALYSRASANPEGEDGLKLRKMVELGSRTYLEKRFYESIEETIVKNPQVAKLGGIPSVLSKFKAYVNIQFTLHKEWEETPVEKIENVPMWALVFYMLRAGYIQEAAAYVKQNQQPFQKADRNFHHYINAYASSTDRRLSRQLADRLQSDFSQRSVSSASNKDIFKNAVYKILGRYDLQKRSLPEVLPTPDDWLWLQLVLTREVKRGDEPAQQVFTLQDLQKAVTAYGVKFMQKDSNVGLYFQILISCGLFEQAIHYLYAFQPVDAIHFAIALVFYGLLNVSTSQGPESELLAQGPNGERLINFSALITQYVFEYRSMDPEDAVDYLSLICLNSDIPNSQLQLRACHEALRELVLHSREFTKLLGDIKADGSREKGAIEKRMRLVKLENQAEFLHTITEQAALQADEDGRSNDAVLLYHLAEDYDTVVQIVNKTLSEWIANEDIPSAPAVQQPSATTSLTAVEDPTVLAKNVMSIYSVNAMVYSKVTQRNQEICAVLLRLAEAKRLFLEGKFEACLKAIQDVDVIPLDREVEMGNIRRKAQNFGSLHETVARNVAILLKMAVDCCGRLAADIKQSPFADAVKARHLAELKAKTKCAMLYAGMIQYKVCFLP